MIKCISCQMMSRAFCCGLSSACPPFYSYWTSNSSMICLMAFLMNSNENSPSWLLIILNKLSLMVSKIFGSKLLIWPLMNASNCCSCCSCIAVLPGWSSWQLGDFAVLLLISCANYWFMNFICSVCRVFMLSACFLSKSYLSRSASFLGPSIFSDCSLK